MKLHAVLDCAATLDRITQQSFRQCNAILMSGRTNSPVLRLASR